MFLLVPAYPGSPGQKAVKRLCVCVCVCVSENCSRSLCYRKTLGDAERNETYFSNYVLIHVYPRESEGLCFYWRWFVCMSVCLFVCLFVCYHDN